MRVILIITLGTLFTGFSEALKNLKEWYQQTLNMVKYKLLSDFKNQKPITTETKNRKNIILNNVNPIYNKYFDNYEKNYNSEDLNQKD